MGKAERIYSPKFEEWYYVADNESVTKVCCPIDQTPLLSCIEYKSYLYSCRACGTTYPWGAQDRELAEVAEHHIKEMKKSYQQLRQETNRLKKIINIATQNNINGQAEN